MILYDVYDPVKDVMVHSGITEKKFKEEFCYRGSIAQLLECGATINGTLQLHLTSDACKSSEFNADEWNYWCKRISENSIWVRKVDKDTKVLYASKNHRKKHSRYDVLDTTTGEFVLSNATAKQFKEHFGCNTHPCQYVLDKKYYRQKYQIMETARG